MPIPAPHTVALIAPVIPLAQIALESMQHVLPAPSLYAYA
jgi:hypothetical protein